MNSVDNGNIKLLSGVPLVIQCGHCSGTEIFWNGNPDVLPDLFFKNMPTGGRMILSKKSIFLACQGCAKDLDAILKEAGKSVLL